MTRRPSRRTRLAAFLTASAASWAAIAGITYLTHTLIGG